ncbi:DUF1525 domain-containing protein [Vibrio sp. PNB22_3_1]
MRFLMCVLLMLSWGCFAAPQDYWPDRVEVFYVDGNFTAKDLRLTRSLFSKTDVEFYKIDENDKFLRSLESSIPKVVLDKGEAAIDAYAREFFVPKLKANIETISLSKVGLAIARTYKLQNVPAVVFDGKYITYGLSPRESVKHYQRWRDANE